MNSKHPRGVNDEVGKPSDPKQIDVAVPANLQCGHVADAPAQSAEPAWAPLTFTFAGIWEIVPHALEEIAATVQIVDVRETTEFSGPLGHIKGATLIPLGELTTRAGELARRRRCHAATRLTPQLSEYTPTL